MAWPELANRVVFQGNLYTIHAILGGEYALSAIGRSSANKRVRRDLLENPDECWCAECDSYAPPDERMNHPKDPENAWIHTTCAAHRQRERDTLEAKAYRAAKAEKEASKRARVLHPWCRSRPWRAGDHVLMPMRVTGWEDDKLTLEPHGGPDDFGMRRSVVVYARQAYPDHVGALTDEALEEIAKAVAEELDSRK